MLTYILCNFSIFDMSSYWFYEPFYTLNDFDRLFDEAFTNRTGGQNQNQNQNQLQRREGGEGVARAMRPR